MRDNCFFRNAYVYGLFIGLLGFIILILGYNNGFNPVLYCGIGMLHIGIFIILIKYAYSLYWHHCWNHRLLRQLPVIRHTEGEEPVIVIIIHNSRTRNALSQIHMSKAFLHK